jgi:MoxR-like ATPase
MEEKRVTVGKNTYTLDPPFFVLATQNPLEMEGTYPLPEAQLDRIFMKLRVEYPDAGSLHSNLNRTTRSREPEVSKVINGAEIQEMRKVVRSVPIAKPVQEYAIRLMMATHPKSDFTHPMASRYVRCGASPRGAQGLVLGARMRALLNDRIHVSSADIRSVALGVLRHRVLLNFEGEAERVSTDTILTEIIKATPEPN